MPEREWPEVGELVVCTVTEVRDFTAVVSLDEYNEHEGLIPIAEIARGWIKHIRDYVREGQKVVCKVLSVNTSRGHIDLSLKDVNEHQHKDKIHEWKNEQKAQKWIGFVAEQSGCSAEDLTKKLYREYGDDLYPVFEDVMVDEEATLKKLGLDSKVAKALVTVASENVKLPKVTISGTLILTSNKHDGVNIIRRALRSAQPAIDDVEIELVYVGAPKYRIKVTAPDYKSAEKAINKAANAAIGVVERADGKGSFIRKQKTGAK